ncbi:MAG: peptide ABC transporter substrate-binding protein, partial [Sulfolobaceae archaeon]
STASSDYCPSLQTIKGFKIINSTAIEIWGNDWFFDPTVAVTGLFLSFNPLGYAEEPAGGYFPWQLYVAMKSVVASGKAAWSSAAATSKGIDWLSLVSPKDVGYILSALENASKSSYIPPSLLEVEKLSNITLVTPQQALAGYQAAINFINTYGNAMIGDGPFILVSWNPSASPPYAKIVKSPYFHLTPPAAAFAMPETFSISFTVPPTVSAGQVLNGTVLGTPIGSTVSQPAPNTSVSIILSYTNGSIISTSQTMTNSNGVFTFTIPSTLQPGAYRVTIAAYTNSSLLINPVTYSLVVLPAITTTTTTTTTTTSITTSTVTSISTTTVTSTLVSTVTVSSSNIGYIAAIIVLIIIIIILAVLLVLRRR